MSYKVIPVEKFKKEAKEKEKAGELVLSPM